MTSVDPQQSIDHLDFDVRCQVGHPEGARQKFLSKEQYEPCDEPAVFVTDVHGHDANNQPIAIPHYWCAKHLAEQTVAIQQWIASIDLPARPYCTRCKQFFKNLGDIIFNLNMIE